MTPSFRGPAVLLLLVVCAGLLPACGKKGPPLAPLARVPTPPANPQAVRIGDDVYVTFGVPSANVSGQRPADVGAIELYAFTGVAPPSTTDLRLDFQRIGTYDVQPVLPEPPTSPDGAPRPAPPAPPGFAQGTTAVVRETLTAEALLPTRRPEPAGSGAEERDVPAGPLLSPSDGAPLKRFYTLVALGPRGVTSTPTATVSVPLPPASSPPDGLTVSYTASAMTIKWTPSADAHVAPPPPDPALLPARPLAPAPPPTRYHVFEASREAPPDEDVYTMSMPAPVSSQPLAATEFTLNGPVQFGVERCFVVRAVDTIAGATSFGDASEPACVTPVDTFPPAPPQRLAAIAGVGVINLIWEPNSESDLGGYLVLRGVAPGDTLQALTPQPIRETTYRDQSVRPDERYVYAVVAVDSATPQNVSGQSNRVEESSRPPFDGIEARPR